MTTSNEDKKKPVVPTTAKPNMRNCLGCNKPFKSTGAGNRICPKCQKDKKRHTHIDMPISKVSVTNTKGDN